MNKLIAVLLAGIVLLGTLSVGMGHYVGKVDIKEPLEVTSCTPFDITVSIYDEYNELYTTYDGNVTFTYDNGTGGTTEFKNVTLNGNPFPYTTQWDPNWNVSDVRGKKTFELHVTLADDVPQTTFYMYVAAAPGDDEGGVIINGSSKIAVTKSGSDAVSLSVTVIPMVRFHVSPNTADFGEMAPCCRPKIGQRIVLYNKGAKSLNIGAIVTGEPFLEGLFINNGTNLEKCWTLNETSQEYEWNNSSVGCDCPDAGTPEACKYFWKNYEGRVPTNHDTFQVYRETDILLKIPQNYGGADGKTGTLTLVASVFEM